MQPHLKIEKHRELYIYIILFFYIIGNLIGENKTC